MGGAARVERPPRPPSRRPRSRGRAGRPRPCSRRGGAVAAACARSRARPLRRRCRATVAASTWRRAARAHRRVRAPGIDLFSVASGSARLVSACPGWPGFGLPGVRHVGRRCPRLRASCGARLRRRLAVAGACCRAARPSAAALRRGWAWWRRPPAGLADGVGGCDGAGAACAARRGSACRSMVSPKRRASCDAGAADPAS